jgi:hypothetical protein
MSNFAHHFEMVCISFLNKNINPALARFTTFFILTTYVFACRDFKLFYLCIYFFFLLVWSIYVAICLAMILMKKFKLPFQLLFTEINWVKRNNNNLQKNSKAS